MTSKKNKYYVYAHVRLDTNKIFYIGKGCNQRKNSIKRNKHWHNIVYKHGYEIKVIEDNMLEEQAFELEVFLIDFIGRKDLNKGTLINLTNGGEGSSGVTQSSETKKKRSLSLMGKARPKDVRDKISDSLKGRTLSESTITKRNKQVVCVETGKIYKSISFAEKELGIYCISRAIHKSLTSGGFHWEFWRLVDVKKKTIIL